MLRRDVVPTARIVLQNSEPGFQQLQVEKLGWSHVKLVFAAGQCIRCLRHNFRLALVQSQYGPGRLPELANFTAMCPSPGRISYFSCRVKTAVSASVGVEYSTKAQL